MADYDLSTPEGNLAYWTDALRQFATGKTVASVSFNSGNGTSQTATYSRGDMPTILTQVRIWQAAVDKANGLTPQRHAIGSGFAPNKRNGYGPFYV
jgi:GH24 family phage-related lysozyme (muramidase)